MARKLINRSKAGKPYTQEISKKVLSQSEVFGGGLIGGQKMCTFW
jgi:hypothetical protein